MPIPDSWDFSLEKFVNRMVNKLLGAPVNDEGKPRHVFIARYDGHVVLENKMEIRLENFIELVRVGEEDDGTSCLGDPSRKTNNSMSDQCLTVLQVHTQIVTHWSLLCRGGHVTLS